MEKEDFALIYLSQSPDETILLGKSIASELKNGDIVALKGELGAGKTVLIKGICNYLQVKENVTSSSFVLLRLLSGKYSVYHFDLYRLNSPDEIYDLGYEEFLFSDGISLIEWAEKIEKYIGEEYLQITLEYIPHKEFYRKILFSPKGHRFQKLMKEIKIPLKRID